MESFKILIDTREQENKHIINVLDKNKIPYEKRTLKIGDYALEDRGGNIFPVVVERKNGLTEILGNLCDKKDGKGLTRFERELEKAYRGNIKMFLLVEVEEGDLYNACIRKQYRNKIDNGKQVYNWLSSLEYRYPNLKIIGTRRELMASLIVNILQYGTKRLGENKIC